MFAKMNSDFATITVRRDTKKDLGDEGKFSVDRSYTEHAL
jgi:hypothetical protein